MSGLQEHTERAERKRTEETLCACCGDEPATRDEWCEGCIEFLWEGSD